MHFFLKSICCLFFTLIFACCSKYQNTDQSHTQSEIPEIVYENLFKKINKNKQTLYVVNFWATWCKPCVDELPDLMSVNNHFSKNPNFKMYHISLDFSKNKDKIVIPFVKKNNINAQVFLMNDSKRMNTWIPMIDKTWSGAIPATVMYKNGKKVYFTEGQLKEKKLKQIISKHL